MSGLIAGFVGGLGKGAAIGGQMAFAQQLREESDEANFLRRSALRREMVGDEISSREETAKLGREHTTSERTGGEKFAAGESLLDRQSKEKIAKYKADHGGTDPSTSNMKNLRFLMSPEGGGKSLKDALIASFPNATISHTDDEGNIGVAVLGDDGLESIGSYRLNDQGVPEFVKPGEKPTRTKATKEEREAKAKEMNTASGAADDYIPFNELSPNDKEVKAAADADLAGGLVGNVMNESMTDQDFDASQPPNAKSLPPAAVKQLKEGMVTTFQNGQRWTLRNGKPEQVK